LFSYPDVRFSFGKAVIAEVEGQVAGMLLSFPGREIRRLERSLFPRFPPSTPSATCCTWPGAALPMLPGKEGRKRRI
jgi:hypothetical protein